MFQCHKISQSIVEANTLLEERTEQHLNHGQHLGLTFVKSSTDTPISYVQWDRLDMWWCGGIHSGGAAEPRAVLPVQPTTVSHWRNLGWISEE